jgi:Flp pilus assembly protein TadG
MRRSVGSFWANEGGAVAPTLALSLFALIAAGGIAFDYARMASMDTELQGAADQAALAAASQLDGQSGACSRAAAAAAGMVANRTYMANDAAGVAITIPVESTCDATGKVRFYQDLAKTQPATSDANARFVEVEVNPRQAYYALTPIVGAFSSGQMTAVAFAGLDSAVCKVPPVMICNPQETGTNTGFDISNLIGKGLRLVSQGGGSGTWAPGNYGYLNTNGGASGAPGIRQGLGWDAPPGDCVESTGVDTKPGVSTTVTDALNTRFDIYDSNTACPTGGSCPASIDSIKDVRRPANASNTGNGCKLHSQGWQPDTSGISYYGADYPRTNASLPATTTPSAMGHPRDICHAVDTSVSGACTGAIGNGVWDRDAYFRTNYGWNSSQWTANTGLSASVAVTASNYASRYNVYAWEIAHQGQTIGGVTVLGQRAVGATGGTLVSYGAPQCSAAQGYGSGTVPSAATPDRRKISVAVVNCIQQGVNGSSTDVQVKDWIDVFLVEPSLNRARTNAGDIYVEVINRTDNASGGGAVQVIKKSVPYLIE